MRAKARSRRHGACVLSWIDTARHPHALLAQGAAPRIRQYISALSTYGGHQKLVLRGDETPKKGGGGGSGGGAGAGDPSNQRIRAACVQARSSDAVVIVPPALGRLRSSAWCRLKEVPRGTRADNAHARDGRTRGEEKGEAADDARYHDAARHKSSVRYRRVPAPHTARMAHARPHPGSKTMKCTG
jgi:hypothetical protein